MKLIKNIISVALVAMLFSGCRGDLLDTAPYDRVSSSIMWTNENLAIQGVNGVYSALRYSRVGLDAYLFEALSVSADCRDADFPILVDKASPATGIFSDYWREHYEGIHRANDAIVNLPNVSFNSEKDQKRYLAEVKFLRAFFYYKLNMVYKGVPLYLEPIQLSECVKGRETEAKIWEQVITDLNESIAEAELPTRYEKGSPNFGRITKSAAYALRGKVYLWTEEYDKAESDFKKVGELGHNLYQGGYKQLFKEANEQSEESIFGVQCLGLSGYGNSFSFRYGSRSTFGSCWNTYLPNTDFVDSYEWSDGKPFNWDDVIPGYSSMTPQARAVFFLRDNMTAKEKDAMTTAKADLSKYLDSGNEDRIKKAYENRDPRLGSTIITPYSEYIGVYASADRTYVLRWPYRSDVNIPYDIRTDTNNRFYYLFRKFVAEGQNEIPNREYSPIDIPLIRYADILLGLAEALNEQGKTSEAINYINLVRKRAGIAELNSNSHTQVKGQDDLRIRIQKERRWEFAGEGVTFFDEIRWKTWKDSKMATGSGLKQMWGEIQYNYTWGGDHIYNWPIPSSERQKISALTQNPGWKE